MPTTVPLRVLAPLPAAAMADVLDSLRLLQRLEYLQAELYTRALAATGFVPATDNPVFDALDISRERGVILEEIKMDEDNPDYLVHEIFTQSFWKDHPLGRPILGTRDTVKKFDRTPVFDFYSQRFSPGNMIITSAVEVSSQVVAEARASASRPPIGPALRKASSTESKPQAA